MDLKTARFAYISRSKQTHFSWNYFAHEQGHETGYFLTMDFETTVFCCS